MLPKKSPLNYANPKRQLSAWSPTAAFSLICGGAGTSLSLILFLMKQFRLHGLFTIEEIISPLILISFICGMAAALIGANKNERSVNICTLAVLLNFLALLILLVISVGRW